MNFTDQIGNTISLSHFPKRIVSLVPSQTELLCHLGLEDQLVGITKFCIHPTEIFKTKARIGGTKKVNFEKVKALQPDLIIANKEENDREQVLALEKIAPVWTSQISNTTEALEMIKQVGAVTNKKEPARTLIHSIENSLEILIQQTAKSSPVPSLYLIWRKPYMSIGGDTYINDMMKKCGLKNLLEHKLRYPTLNNSEIQTLNPKCILLSSEPFPFKEKHVTELNQLCPKAVIKLVDGEFFSWYGNRMLPAISYLTTLHNELVTKNIN